MRTFGFSHFALVGCVAGALLAGCGGSQPLIGATAQAFSHATHADRGTSWMLPEAKKIKRLLYVSSGNNYVSVYDYETGKQVGKLTDFDDPYGQCVDAKGDVFIANYTDGKTDEYARGGTVRIARYSTDGSAIGCSVSSGGDLAVTDFSTKSGSGQVCIWKRGKGPSRCYDDNDDCHNMWPAGYDNKGNLYVESDTSGGPVCELPRGGSVMKAVVISGSGSPYSQGSVMWDGKYITLAGEAPSGYSSGIARATESSSGGLTIVGTTELSGCNYSIDNPFIVGKGNTPVSSVEGNAVVGSILFCNSGSNLYYWPYPAGGYPTSSLANPPQIPQGESVSIAP